MGIDFKKNFVIVNYPTGAFGSFLSHCLYKSGKFYSLPASDNIFESSGAAHKNHPKVINNFHQYHAIKEWADKSIEDRVTYLEENFLVNYNKEILYLLRITSPEHTCQLKEIFDENKIIEITVSEKLISVLEQILIDKVYNVYDSEEIQGKKYNNKLNTFFAKKAARYFIDQSLNIKGNNIIQFEDFFHYEKFIASFKNILENLNLTVDEKSIKILYEKFKIANAKYFSIYNTLSHA